MAGGRDPWRGADKPSQLQSYGDLPPRRAAGQPPRAPEPPSAAGPSASFDSRSIFIGPADQDPRPAREPRDRPHRSPYGDDGFSSAPAEPDSSVFADPYAPPGPPAPPDDADHDDWQRPSHAAGSHRTARSWRQRVLLGVGVFLVVMCFAGATVAYWVVRTYNSIDRVDGLELNAVAAGEPENYLVVGSDSREGLAGKRSDSIMILRVDPKSEQAYALSFPRDLQVQIAGSGETDKINSAYNGDEGIQRLIDTLQQNFAVPIHHYVEIDFVGFERLIEHLDGIPLYFDQAVRNPPGAHDVGLHITELGCVTVEADQALALARSRVLQYRGPEGWVDDPYGDYGRMTRQQIVIKQALKKAVQQAKADPMQLKSMAELAAGTVTLDRTLTISDLLGLADQFQDFDPNNLLTFSLPTRTLDEEGKGDPYPNEALAEPVLNAFRGLPIDEIGPSLIDLTVVNGSGQEGQAANVGGAFQKIGFDVTVAPGAAPEPVARTTVFHAPGGEAYGRRVARHLESGADVQPRDDLAPGEVELVAGADFTNVFEEPAPIGATTTTVAPPASGDSGGSADTTATTAAPAASTATTAPPAPPPSTPQVGYPAGQPPPGKSCG
ncbi:MAG TPA: LCP family protein [Acidimicrobiales bacterium]|nr:LCP family protein [Acidimicrobiales bacterium]